MFCDEAGFGRISEPANCWAPPQTRPAVPCQRIREYKAVYGAVSPIDGESLFIVLDKCNSENMQIFYNELTKKFPDELILLCMDKASYHTSNKLTIPKNIIRFFIPPRTPEMNPIELVWREIRKRGFKNKAFLSIQAVVDKFHEVVGDMTNDTFISATCWEWVKNVWLGTYQ